MRSSVVLRVDGVAANQARPRGVDYCCEVQTKMVTLKCASVISHVDGVAAAQARRPAGPSVRGECCCAHGNSLAGSLSARSRASLGVETIGASVFLCLFCSRSCSFVALLFRVLSSCASALRSLVVR